MEKCFAWIKRLMISLDGLQHSLHPCALDKSIALELEGLNMKVKVEEL